MAARKNIYINEEPLVTLRRSSASIHMTLISIIQGAVLSYLAIVLADNFRDLDLARWLAVALAFFTMVGTWQETIMMAHTTLEAFRFRDSFLFFCLGGAQFVVIRALLPDVPYSYIFFAGTLFLFFSIITLINQYRSIQINGPYQEIFRAMKMQLRSKAKTLLIPIIFTISAGVVLLFFHDLWLTVALVVVNLLAQIFSLWQEALSWNGVFRYSIKAQQQ